MQMHRMNQDLCNAQKSILSNHLLSHNQLILQILLQHPLPLQPLHASTYENGEPCS